MEFNPTQESLKFPFLTFFFLFDFFIKIIKKKKMDSSENRVSKKPKIEEIDYANYLIKILWRYIFLFSFDGKQLRNLCCVNKKFNLILKEKAIWKNVVEKGLSNDVILSLNYFDEEASFDNIWKSFSAAKKKKHSISAIYDDSSTSYFLCSHNAKSSISLSINDKNGDELIFYFDFDSIDYEIIFYCGYLDQNNLVTKKGKKKKKNKKHGLFLNTKRGYQK